MDSGRRFLLRLKKKIRFLLFGEGKPYPKTETLVAVNVARRTHNLISGKRERRGKNLTGLRDLSGFSRQPKQKSLPCTGQKSRGETLQALRVGENFNFENYETINFNYILINRFWTF
jgi:hypothetical protein